MNSSTINDAAIDSFSSPVSLRRWYLSGGGLSRPRFRQPRKKRLTRHLTYGTQPTKRINGRGRTSFTDYVVLQYSSSKKMRCSYVVGSNCALLYPALTTPSIHWCWTFRLPTGVPSTSGLSDRTVPGGIVHTLHTLVSKKITCVDKKSWIALFKITLWRVGSVFGLIDQARLLPGQMRSTEVYRFCVFVEGRNRMECLTLISWLWTMYLPSSKGRLRGKVSLGGIDFRDSIPRRGGRVQRGRDAAG